MKKSCKLALLFIVCHFSVLFAQENGGSRFHKRQFRGVWIATVRNLDWPSRPGLSVGKMKKEFTRQLDQLRDVGMNAVVVQVRPTGDSFYPSQLEPWSSFLTGKQGQAPPRSFDPLEFMIEETHKRCMEFHAWFNPYRAIRNFQEGEIFPKHIYLQHPEWFVRYGKDLYFDPGIVPARKFVEQVIADVVSRYDIDAVHFDDYFYPYRLEGEEYPDSLSFALYGGEFYPDEKEDWRRENVNLLVKELFDTINQIKPWVHFGISPFGVWRNNSQDPRGSATSVLQTNYDDLFADVLVWLENGWLDYVVPQCYQYMGRPIMDYRIVARWWDENHYGVNYYIGQGPFRLGATGRGEAWAKGNEIARQLYFNDSISSILGSVFFRSQTFMENPQELNELLKNQFYKYPALPPVSSHDLGKRGVVKITPVEIKETRRWIKLKWETDQPEQVRYYVVYRSKEVGNPEEIITLTPHRKFKVKKADLGPGPYNLCLTAVDRYRTEINGFSVILGL
ncbi:MAG: family 10 glycosylhydrolase [Phaeodactylibacter sp.]|nr:family 10 glycosylhydrolase [Phaeodactylibacter sp.]